MRHRWRLFLLALALVHGLACQPVPKPKVLVLGFDGMDPKLLRQFIEQGHMPNFKALAQQGQLRELATTNPPQSPVAWSTFITGVDPAAHGVFDFVHRNPKTLQVVPSLTAVKDGAYTMEREGRPFWRELRDAGVPARLIKLPAAFPAVESEGEYLTDMGTPDLEGTYGTYSFYTNAPHFETSDSPRKAGRRLQVEVREDEVKGSLVGPQDKTGNPESVGFRVLIDPSAGAAMFESQHQKALLKAGEWSPWLPVKFPSAKGMVRVYLKSLKPYFELYVSPINIDPLEPAIPISQPQGLATELAHECGRFYTQGLPEETDALLDGLFEDDDFLSQNSLVVQEREALLRRELKQFRQGFLFFYVSSTDILSHLYWNTIDPKHPGYHPERAKKYREVILGSYQLADRMLGEAVKASGADTTIIALSDHGFAPYRRSVNLNLWLRQKGYQKGQGESIAGIDWSNTRAYAVGFNGLYLNLKGREAQGTVSPNEREALLSKLAVELKTFTDPETGLPLIAEVEILPQPSSPQLQERSPDLLVGYQRGYRASWETALGGAGKALVSDNLQAWSGDHLMSPKQVPGVLVSNRAPTSETAHLRDLAPSILGLYGLPPRPDWKGRALWK